MLQGGAPLWSKATRTEAFQLICVWVIPLCQSSRCQTLVQAEPSECQQNDGNVGGNAQSSHDCHGIYIWSYLKNRDKIYVPEDD